MMINTVEEPPEAITPLSLVEEGQLEGIFDLTKISLTTGAPILVIGYL